MLAARYLRRRFRYFVPKPYAYFARRKPYNEQTTEPSSLTIDREDITIDRSDITIDQTEV